MRECRVTTEVAVTATYHEDETFMTVYTVVRCVQGLITIPVNVLTIMVILKFKKVS